MRTARKAAAAVLVVAAVGALGATSATAGMRRLDRSPAIKRHQVPAVVQAIAARLGTRSVLTRPGARLLAAMARQATPQAHSAFTGFAYCTEDAFQQDEGELFVWPVADSGHMAVLTISYLVSSATPNFANPTVDASGWALVEYGGQFYLYDPANMTVISGPFDYEDAWRVWSWQSVPDLYRVVVNQAFYVDDGYLPIWLLYVVPAFGPDAI